MSCQRVNSTIFKTWLSDINKTALALESLSKIKFNVNAFSVADISKIANVNNITGVFTELQSISKADYGDFGALKIQESAMAVSGLSGELQASSLLMNGFTEAETATILSTNGLTDSEIEQALAFAQSGESIKLYNAEVIKAGLQNSALSSTEQKLVLDKLGLIDATTGELVASKEVSQAKLQEALINIGLEESEAAVTAERIISTITQGTQKASMEAIIALTKKQIIENAKYIASMVAAHPVATALGVALTALGAAILYNKHQEEEYQEALKESVSTMSTATSEYSQSASTLDELTEKYKTLKKQLDNTDLSESEAYQIKSDLYDIQCDLIDNFGNEAKGIDLVNGEYREQLGLLQQINKESADAYLTKNKEDYDKNISYLTDKEDFRSEYTSDWSSKNSGYMSDDLRNILEANGLTIDAETWRSELGGAWTKYYVEFSDMTREEAYDMAMKLGETLRQAGEENADLLEDPYYDLVQSYLSYVTTDLIDETELNSAKENADYYEKLSAMYSSSFGELYNSFVDARDEYLNALQTGKGIEEAKLNFDTIYGNFSNSSKAKSDEITNAFEDVKNSIDEELIKLNNWKKSLSGSSELNILSELKVTDDQLRGINWDDEFTSPAEDAFGNLLTYLGASREDIEQVIGLLIKMGAVIGEVQGSTLDDETDISFAQAWNTIGTTGTDEEKKKAQETKEQLLELAEAGKLTTEAFENSSIAEDFLNDTKLSAEEATKKINTLVEETKQLASLKSGISSITSAYDEKKDSKTNTVSSSTLESMYDTLGVAEWDKTTQKAWQNYKKNASSSSKSMNDLKESQDKLATAYVNSNNFLSNLNKTNQDYYEGLLTEMGITNAHEITTNILNYRISDQIQKKLEAKSASIDFSNATHEEIDGLISYGGQLGLTEKQINSFILKQSLANNNPLSTSSSIENMKAIGEQLTLTGKQLTWYTKLMQAANTINAAKFTYVDDKTLKKSEKDVKKYTKKIQGYQNVNLDIQSSSGDKSNDSGSNDSGNNSKKDNSSQTRSTETIDWIARRLEVLQSAIDLTKAKFENLFRFQAKKNNLNAQIKQTTKLLQAQEKVADRYAKKAANVSLSSNLKKKVKKGQIDGKLSELLKDYDEDTANKISKYQEYWDKSQDSQKSVQELKKSRKELMDQKDQLHVDRAEQKISTLDAKAEISNTAKEKNRLENKKIEQLKESYQYQIKIAEREKNSIKVTELRARKEKEILEIKKQILQNTLDENEATRSYNDARYANAKTVAEKNAILDHDIESYRSDQQANETYYSQLVSNTQKKAKKSLGTNALMSSLASSQVAEKNKILDLIKKGNPIPDSILNRKNVKNHPDLLNKLIEYNNSLDDITKEVEKVQQDKDKADQETKTAIREKEIQKLQNNAEAAEANYNLSKIREDNAITAKEKNKQEENSRASLIEQYDYLKKIAETNGDIVEQQRLEEELQEKIAQSYQTEFHNIKAEYEKKTTLNEGNISSTQAEISALQAQGKAVSESFYGSLLNDTRYKKKLLIEEKNDLEDKLASLEVGSDAWYEAIETLDNLDVSIIKCDEDTAQFTKTINEQKLALLSLKTAQIQSGIDHVSFLIDELSHKDLTKKESGGFTTEGLTVLSLYASQMQQNKDKLASVRASYDEFQKQVALGISNLSEEEIHAKNDDYMKQIQDIISANSALKDSMISLVKEGFEVQLDSLNELIDTRKKALQSEKNLYDYQRKVADQTKTITNIEKQMAALSGDDSEETRAKLQKLAVELDTAKQDLEDTEYDQWISDQEELLDSLSEDFEDFMENMLRDTDALIEQVIEAINQNGDIVSSTLSSLGYGNASTVSTIDNGDGTHTTTITDYNGNTTSLTFDQKGNVISSSKEADKKSAVLDILNNYAERRGYARNPVEALFLNAGYNNYLSEEAIEKLSSISGKSWTSADDQNEANAVYNWLKEIGFANGGVVGGNSYSGDRLWARVNSGESILTRKFTDLLPETLHTMNRFINLPSCNLPSLPVTNAQPALQMGNIDIHLDGSSVTDPKSFVDVFKNSREMQTAVQNATIGQIARSYSNSLNI